MADYLVEPRFRTSGSLVGTGGSSTVTVEVDPRSDRKIAIKRIYSNYFHESNFIREVELLVKLNHPCVLRIVGYSFPSESTCAEIHTEYAENGSLASVLKRATRNPKPSFWTPTGKAIAICGIVLGMRDIHSRGLIHRDLKPGNIFISADGHSLIGDFGTSRFEFDDATLTSDTGTPHYAAPELFQETTPYTTKVDVFSLGSVMYEIILGFPVFPSSLQPFPIMRQVLAGDMPPVPIECGKFMQGLIRRCWAKNPEERPSMHEIFNEFQSNQFEIVPGAMSDTVREYVLGVIAWETSSTLSQA
jgi:serine/threonine protein kinase